MLAISQRRINNITILRGISGILINFLLHSLYWMNGINLLCYDNARHAGLLVIVPSQTSIGKGLSDTNPCEVQRKALHATA